VLDRSWYGRVLVERVEGFASEKEWKRAYDQIVEFERMLTAEGAVLVKFWMHISFKEQLERFEARRDDPLKSWKLTDEDWRNRDKRDAYEAAIEEMFERTDTKHAHWHIVPGESKHYARVHVIETVIREVEHGLERQGIATRAAS
jgi:polyphosphate kinase 2 (PPK2 family)